MSAVPLDGLPIRVIPNRIRLEPTKLRKRISDQGMTVIARVCRRNWT
jgi:hypothetical protein